MGIEVHANILDNLLPQRRSRPHFSGSRLPRRTIRYWLYSFFRTGSRGLVQPQPPVASTISLILVLAAFFWFSYFSFSHWGLWTGFVVPAGTLVVNYAAITSLSRDHRGAQQAEDSQNILAILVTWSDCANRK